MNKKLLLSVLAISASTAGLVSAQTVPNMSMPSGSDLLRIACHNSATETLGTQNVTLVGSKPIVGGMSYRFTNASGDASWTCNAIRGDDYHAAR